MSKRVIVWGTGNVGRPAIRAVLAHSDLDLAGVIVANPDKVGQDAGTIAGVGACGVAATDGWQSLIQQDIDCIVYTSSADTRGEEAFGELFACLQAGVNVVSTSFYPLLYPKGLCEMREVVEPISQICEQSGASVLVSGVDPGWAMDLLPIVMSGVVSGIEQIRMQEIFNYSLYDAPEVVREVIGFGGPMEQTPQMLEDFALKMVWAPMVQMVADQLGWSLNSIETHVERRALEKTVNTDTMGRFDEGTQGAFRFEVRGMNDGKQSIVLEHITRIHDDCAPDWPYPPEGQGCHQVNITGNPNLSISFHGEDPVEPGPAGGGNCSAANRIVNAIPAVCSAKPGIVTALDLPLIHGGPQRVA